MRKLVLGFVLASLWSVGAHAADREVWQSVTAVGVEQVWYGDLASVQRGDGTARAQFLMVPATPAAVGPKPAIAIAMQDRFDCRARTSQAVSFSAYAADGSATTGTPSAPPESAQAGSVAAALLDYACSGKRSVDDFWVYATWRQAYDAARGFFDRTP